MIRRNVNEATTINDKHEKSIIATIVQSEFVIDSQYVPLAIQLKSDNQSITISESQLEELHIFIHSR